MKISQVKVSIFDSIGQDRSGVYCVSGIDGKSECEEIKRGGGNGGDGGDGEKKPLRISIQTLLNS